MKKILLNINREGAIDGDIIHTATIAQYNTIRTSLEMVQGMESSDWEKEVETALIQDFQRDLGYSEIDIALKILRNNILRLSDRGLSEAIVGELENILKLIPEVKINK